MVIIFLSHSQNSWKSHLKGKKRLSYLTLSKVLLNGWWVPVVLGSQWVNRIINRRVMEEKSIYIPSFRKQKDIKGRGRNKLHPSRMYPEWLIWPSMCRFLAFLLPSDKVIKSWLHYHVSTLMKVGVVLIWIPSPNFISVRCCFASATFSETAFEEHFTVI